MPWWGERRPRVVGIQVSQRQVEREDRGGTSWVRPLMDGAARWRTRTVVVSDDDPLAAIERGRFEFGATAFFFNDVAEADSRAIALFRDGVPFATMGRLAPPFPQSWVDIDNRGAMRLALDHLWDAGHRRIGLAATISPGYWWAERIAAYSEWAVERGLDPEADLVRAPHHRLVDFVIDRLESKEPPTAFLSPGDGTCHQVYAAAAAVGLEVGARGPGRVSVVGFDPDLRLTPTMTTLEVDFDRVAHAMWQQLAAVAGWRYGGVLLPPITGRLLPARLRLGASSALGPSSGPQESPTAQSDPSTS